MPKYSYVLVNQSGIKSKGLLIAPNLQSAQRKLKKQSDIIISIVEEKNLINHFWEKPSLSFQDKVLFTKNLTTMVQVGITLTESFRIIINQTRQKNSKKMYQNILEMLETGQSLSKSLRPYEYIFGEVFINMIATGEKSGNLEKVLRYLDVQLEKEYEVRKKVISAFIYPVIILGLTLLITVGIVLFIMPKITKIFKSFDIELPLITKMLIGLNEFIINKPFTTILGLIGLIAFFVMIFRLKKLKPYWQKVMLYFPVFNKIIIYSNLARFCRTLNSLIQSGIPLTKALDISSKMSGNVYYQRLIKQAKEKVETGGSLGKSLEGNERLFPEISTKMISIGEKTGSLEVTTEKLATLYEGNVDAITRNLSVLLEPLLLVFMAVLVGGIALSIVLPIYQLPSLLNK
ncbi:type II secretion system F family protein [Candidatus Peregrinibacteria bacterium]|nr:type II secretion system F family protein [Candidatus Peregrinibacteria bacterium]